MSEPVPTPVTPVSPLWKRVNWQSLLQALTLLAALLGTRPTPDTKPTVDPNPDVVVVDPAPKPPAEPEQWIIKDASGRRIVDATLEKVAGSLKAGKYDAEGIPKPGEMSLHLAITVDDGFVPVVVDPPKPPTPPLPPAPVPDAGLRTMIVYETDSDADGTLPKGQAEIIRSTAPGSVRDYLNTHCVKVNGEPERRILDKDQPDGLSRESAIWQAVWKRPRPTLPWVVISNGKDGFEGPLPATPAECLALLQKYEVK